MTIQELIIKYHNQQKELATLRKELSPILVAKLIEKFGNQNKAAKAIGEQPSNLCNVTAGKRFISWDKLLEFSQYLS